MTSDLCFATARELSRALRRREVSAREVVQAHLDQIDRVNPEVNAVVTLVAERALAVRPDLVMDEATVRSIAEICVRVDGLPLALELAAARVKLLPPATLMARSSANGRLVSMVRRR